MTGYKIITHKAAKSEICPLLNCFGDARKVDDRQRICLLCILFLKEKIDQIPVTTTQFGDKIRLESVKGCQWELIYDWTSVLATFLHPHDCRELRRFCTLFMQKIEILRKISIFCMKSVQNLVNSRQPWG